MLFPTGRGGNLLSTKNIGKRRGASAGRKLPPLEGIRAVKRVSSPESRGQRFKRKKGREASRLRKKQPQEAVRKPDYSVNKRPGPWGKKPHS